METAATELATIKQSGVCNDLQVGRRFKKRMEDLTDLREHISAIHAAVCTGENGQEEIQVSISLLPSFSTSSPSA
jgi:hypothetical protein